MTRKLFGTDGVRGRANTHPMTAETALKLGAAAGRFFRTDGKNGHRVVIGKDTRLSGYMFESALEAGLAAAGANVLLLGPMPTPAVAYLTRTLRASAGERAMPLSGWLRPNSRIRALNRSRSSGSPRLLSTITRSSNPSACKKVCSAVMTSTSAAGPGAPGQPALASSASSSSIMRSIRPRPFCQKAGSVASRPKGASSSL